MSARCCAVWGCDKVVTPPRCQEATTIEARRHDFYHVQEIESDPGAFVRRLEAGESLVVLRDECPLAEVRHLLAHATGLRPFGLCAGRFSVPADFDHALPDDVLKDFEGR